MPRPPAIDFRSARRSELSPPDRFLEVPFDDDSAGVDSMVSVT
jgi:hypothetical protein